MRVLICGCGYVGTALGLLLATGGHTSFGLRRDPSKLPPEILPVQADLADPLLPNALPRALDAAVYAVSPSASGGPPDFAQRAAHVDGPRRLLAALETQPSVRRLVLVSSTGVYAQTGGEWVDETSPTDPGSASGKRLLQGERLVSAVKVPAVILRLGGIYGPGRTGMIDRARRIPPENEPPRYTNRIHRDDCAGALLHLLTHPDPQPLYLGVDCDPADRHTVAAWLASRLGPAPNEHGSQPPATPRARSNKRCSNRRLLDSGYDFRYPTFREGFAELLENTDRTS